MTDRVPFAAFPAGILHSTKTGRFHPIVYRQAPMPSGADEDHDVMRYKSKMHHTEGLPTREGALAAIAAQPQWWATGMEWEWDGEGLPLDVCFFGRPPAKVPE